MNKISRRKFIKASSIGSFSLWLPNGTVGYTIADVRDALAKGKNIATEELDTPALVLDLDVFERNVKRMAEACHSNRIAFRPHTKTHKCPEIAKVQLNSGAVGICTAKVSEAEVMVNAGIENVHITSPVVTRQKINRLMEIRKKSSGVMVVVDNPQNVKDLADASLSRGLVLNVLVDINPQGHMRTGSPPGQPAVELAKIVLQSKGLRLRGIQSYAGGAQHIGGFENRKQKSLEMMTPALESREMMG
ncbi:MAG: alanine racemase [Patescibacteria group bacterium]|nr:alanine racemase [Patescibacteria group bacterium]